MSAPVPLMPETDFALDPVEDLHARLAELRRRERAAPVWFRREVGWMITHHADVGELLRDEERVPAGPGYELQTGPVQGRTLQCMGGEEHRLHRALVSGAFLRSQIQRRIEALLEPTAHALIDAFEARGEAELVAQYSRRFPFAVIMRLLGLPGEADEQFIRWADGLFDYPYDPEGALRASEEFGSYLAPLIEARRREPQGDLLSLLIHAEIEGQRLSDAALLSFMKLLFPAGADTTYHALGNLIFAVLGQPQVEQRVRSGRDQVALAVEETLRWETPVPIVPRYLTRDLEFAGCALPAQSWILLSITAANRDPRVFPDPDRFDLDRPNKEQLTFGRGLHFCLGSHLARAELQVGLAALLERLPGLRLRDPAAVRITSGVLRGPETLPVRF
jgi:cytochrome P450